MFGLKKTKTKQELLAVQTGEIVALESLPDPVFAERVLGDGFAIDPVENRVYSPVAGKVVDVQDTFHAYAIHTDDGLDVLVHIGIDTVALQGEGFSPKVKTGDKVKAGDLLCEADLALIKQKGLPIYTVVLVTNIDSLKDFQVTCGEAVARQTVAMTYTI